MSRFIVLVEECYAVEAEDKFSAMEKVEKEGVQISREVTDAKEA